MEMVPVVQESNGRLIFPPQIPEKRGNNETWTKICLIPVFLGLSAFYVESLSCMCTNIIYSSISFIGYKCLSRILCLSEEFKHLRSRYKGSLCYLLKDCLWFNNISSITILILLVAIIILFITEPIKTKVSIAPLAFSLISVFLYVDIIKMDECPVNTAKMLGNLNDMDFGAGMAHNYFAGYLNILLPCTGDERKGLKETIEIFESREQVDFPIKKLFILIPMSGFSPTKVSDRSVIFKYSKKLESRIIHRAGTLERVYHTSAYKLITEAGKHPFYVCAEYATPLLTLFEVMQLNTSAAHQYKKYHPELVTNFYITLRKLIKESRLCCDLCELIYYKDVDEDGNQLPHLDDGRLIYDRIMQIQNSAR